MIVELSDKKFSIGVFTHDHERLAQWYKDTLGLKEKGRMNLPNDTFIEFEFGDNYFWIGLHDKIAKAKNTEPYRIMIGFHVASVTQAYEELKNKDIEFVATPFAEPSGSGIWCMTIKDIDGNIVQFTGDT